jgi:polar amino acid transport system substrate-binding protein
MTVPAREGARRGRATRAAAVALAVALAAGITAGCTAHAAMSAKPRVAPIQPGTLVTGGASASPAPVDNSCNPAAISRRPEPGDAAGADVQKIKSRGKLIVGVSQDGFLTGYISATGQVEGFDIDIARQLELALFGTADDAHIQFVPVTLAQRITDVQNAAVDLVVDTMTITCQRAAQVAFSTVYYAASQRLLVYKDAKGNPVYPTLAALTPAQKVCVQSGSTSAGSILSQPKHPQLYEVQDASDCLVALQQNEVDAVATDDTLLAGLSIQDTNTIVAGSSIEPEPYGIAVSKNAPDLVGYVNGVLENIRANGTWAAIYSKWFEKELGPASPPPAAYAD